MKNIVITGVSTGIGYSATCEFINGGYHVFGSVRKKDDAARLKREFGNNFTPLIFDITDHNAIRESVKLVEELVGSSGLNGLINNAGAATGAPLMHVPIDEFKWHLDVLLTGQLAVTQAFLPLLGAKPNWTNKPGRIINVTSLNGKIAAPFLGSYVAAKHAMEGLSSTLRIELKMYGIDVIVVGPGMINTNILQNTHDEDAKKYSNSDYYSALLSFTKIFRAAFAKEAMKPEDFAKRLRKIFETKNPKTRYAVVKNKFKNWYLFRVLPDKMIANIYARMLGMGRK